LRNELRSVSEEVREMEIFRDFVEEESSGVLKNLRINQSRTFLKPVIGSTETAQTVSWEPSPQRK